MLFELLSDNKGSYQIAAVGGTITRPVYGKPVVLIKSFTAPLTSPKSSPTSSWSVLMTGGGGAFACSFNQGAIFNSSGLAMILSPLAVGFIDMW